MGKTIKVLLVLVVALALATGAFAKSKGGDSYETGNWFLAGSTNLNFAFGTDTFKADVAGAKETETSHTVFGLGTRAGYFVIDGFEVGLGLSYDYDKAGFDKNSGDMDVTTTDLFAGIQAAYFLNMGGTDPFIAVLLGYGSMGTETEPNTGASTSNTASGFGADVDLGVNFLLNSKVSLAPSLYLSMRDYSGTMDVSTTDATGKTTTAEQDYDTGMTRYGLRLGVFAFL